MLCWAAFQGSGILHCLFSMLMWDIRRLYGSIVKGTVPCASHKRMWAQNEVRSGGRRQGETASLFLLLLFYQENECVSGATGVPNVLKVVMLGMGARFA